MQHSALSVEISPPAAAHISIQNKPARLAKLDRWFAMLQTGQYMNMVTQWAIDCALAPRSSWGDIVRQHGTRTAIGLDGRLKDHQLEMAALLSLVFPQSSPEQTQTPAIEVHDSAACLLWALGNGEPCSNPNGLETASLNLFAAEKVGQGLGRAAVIIELAKRVASTGTRLCMEKCTFAKR